MDELEENMAGIIIRDEKMLQYMVDLAEDRIPDNELCYRIETSNLEPSDEAIEAIWNTPGYDEWLLDPLEAEKMLLKFYYRSVKSGQRPDPIVEEFVLGRIKAIARGQPAESVFSRKKIKDRRKELETERLRAEVILEKRRPKETRLKGESALDVVADRHGISPHTLESRLRRRLSTK